ncbi:hypothetical protein TNCV_1909901 [Trichonephila clavipes]|nr:hypothetical protein TNCV_1909901 [Trichonephila clavipes]
MVVVECCRRHRSVVVDRKSLEHPLYLPHMSPCYFDLFPKLKEPQRGYQFHDISSARFAIEPSVACINIQHLTNGLQRLPDFWQKVIRSVGDYLEGT